MYGILEIKEKMRCSFESIAALIMENTVTIKKAARGERKLSTKSINTVTALNIACNNAQKALAKNAAAKSQKNLEIENYKRVRYLQCKKLLADKTAVLVAAQKNYDQYSPAVPMLTYFSKHPELFTGQQCKVIDKLLVEYTDYVDTVSPLMQFKLENQIKLLQYEMQLLDPEQ